MRPPSVDSLANTLLETGLPQPLCVDIAREAILECTDAAGKGNTGEGGTTENAKGEGGTTENAVLDLALSKAKALQKNMLGAVVNATGVLLHTNMGRAPYQFSQPVAYTNLELDIETGKRSSRQHHIASLFARLTGAEAGLVVNNCSAAVTLILAALAGGDETESGKAESGKITASGGVASSKKVIVSRGELVEIGGGFRVPEVITSAGAQLIEVGTTNRTRLKDYEKAIKKHATQNQPVALLLKVHQSNYTLKGFTESVSVSDLAGLGVLLVVDLGSGLLDASLPWIEFIPNWLANEPAVKQTLEAGADLVAFSGDKLLGGPQAGIIVGKAELIQKCSEHPLARAFRLGGLSVAALLDIAMKYLNREGEKIPFWQMATLTLAKLEARAEEVLLKLSSKNAESKNAVKTGACISLAGGGTLPDAEIPSFGIHINGDIAAQLRQHATPIIARVQDGKTIIDLRTVLPEQDEILVTALSEIISTD